MSIISTKAHEVSPKEWLEAQGIKLAQTALFCVIDGYVRQPDLCGLMKRYADERYQTNTKSNGTGDIAK